MSAGSARPHTSLARGLRAAVLVLGLVAALGLVGLGVAVEVSSRPSFCGSCHIMAPYYQSWKESSHHNVACVDCHIPPGVTAEIRKKYQALSMVVKYFTGTYSTNPWAEVDDASCLRCHERRLLAGKELFGDVIFDHTGHLASARRGTELRCTSCHGQIVQGSHIAVTASTCTLCHFKGQQEGQGLARCTLCHQVPETVIRRGTLSFNHGDVGRFGMDCTSCHARPKGFDGAVLRERCLTCHNQPERLERIEDSELLHRAHVTEHKVECLHCHSEVRHVGEPRIEQAVESCDTCHEDGHSPQLNLFAGLGGRGVEPMPSAMFEARVRCEGCHIALPGHAGEVKRASEVSCMSCHGPTYGKILERWQEALTDRTRSLALQLDRTSAALGGNGSPEPRLADARHNLALVTRGKGVHNVDYAFALLSRAHLDMNAARAERGLAPLPRPWPELESTAGSCGRCHQGIETQRGSAFGRHFAHQAHLVRAGLACDACHRPHEERSRDEVVRFGPAGCNDCHHREAKADDCLACHGDVKSRTVKSYRGDFDHGYHVDEEEMSCDECHEQPDAQVAQKFCKDCHRK